MTEHQALRKWCPFSRVDSTYITPNRSMYGNNILEGSNCIASQCMAWRFWGGQKNILQEEKQGFCGLTDEKSATYALQNP